MRRYSGGNGDGKARCSAVCPSVRLCNFRVLEEMLKKKTVKPCREREGEYVQDRIYGEGRMQQEHTKFEMPFMLRERLLWMAQKKIINTFYLYVCIASIVYTYMYCKHCVYASIHICMYVYLQLTKNRTNVSSIGASKARFPCNDIYTYMLMGNAYSQLVLESVDFQERLILKHFY